MNPLEVSRCLTSRDRTLIADVGCLPKWSLLVEPTKHAASCSVINFNSDTESTDVVAKFSAQSMQHS